MSTQTLAEKEKSEAALSSVIAAVFLTAIKIVVGVLTGSLGILAEAAHSALDLVAALVTFFAVRISDKPPDEQHQYGHGKVENLSALFETLLLLATCVWIIYEAINRLFFESVEVEASFWAFGVMAVSIVVDISRSRVLYAAARKHNSQALEADALHFSTDVWSSSVVIVGLVLVWIGERLGPSWDWLAKADAVAALGVAIIVVYVSVELGKRTITVLLDSAPPGLNDKILEVVGQIPGVQSVEAVRVRQAGAATFVDLNINVERSAALEEADQIASQVDRSVSKLIQQGDIIIHVNPVRRAGENLPQTVSALAARLGLRSHDVHAHMVQERYFVDMHVEASANMTLGQAHELVSQLEDALRAEMPQVGDIHSHIEPLGEPAIPVESISTEQEAALKARILTVVREIPGINACHHLQVRPGPEGYDIAFHCMADAEMNIVEAHRLSDEVEHKLRRQIPGISRVLVHVEPEEEKNDIRIETVGGTDE
ncbi:cation-efflux pump [Chloroflexota bacterium]